MLPAAAPARVPGGAPGSFPAVRTKLELDRVRSLWLWTKSGASAAALKSATYVFKLLYTRARFELIRPELVPV